MTEFYMHRKFADRLATLYRDPHAAAQELRKRTASNRKRLGCEVPKLCTRPGMLEEVV